MKMRSKLTPAILGLAVAVAPRRVVVQRAFQVRPLDQAREQPLFGQTLQDPREDLLVRLQGESFPKWYESERGCVFLLGYESEEG